MTEDNRPGTDQPQALPPESPPPVAAPAEPPPAAPPASAMDGWLARFLIPAYEAKGWLKFLGIVCIVIGGFHAITIVGLLVAWLYVWLGVLLWQAGDRAVQATHMRDPSMLEQYLRKLKTVIVIAGVVTVISVVATVLSVIMVLTFGWMAAVMEAIKY